MGQAKALLAPSPVLSTAVKLWESSDFSKRKERRAKKCCTARIVGCFLAVQYETAQRRNCE